MFGVRTGGGDDRFQAGLLLGQLVEVGVLVRVGGIDLVQLGLCLHHFAEGGFDFFLDRLGRVELRLLWQVADGNAGQVLDLAVVFLVHAGHDAEHGGLAGAVQAEQADLGAGEEGQGNVLDDLTLGRDDLADPQHGHDVLSHLRLPERKINKGRSLRGFSANNQPSLGEGWKAVRDGGGV